MKAAEAIKAASRSTLIVLVSSMHPDEVPPSAYAGFADTLLWKSALAPRVLDQAWLGQRDELASPP